MPSDVIEKVEAPPRTRTRSLLLAVGAVTAVVGLLFWLHYRYRESTDDAQIEGHIETIAPRVGGTVVEVDVNDNQAVHAGDVLFKLDDRDYRVALDRARAELAATEAASRGAQTAVPITRAASGGTLTGAEAAMQEARAGDQVAYSQLAQAQAQLGVAQANLRQAEANAQRADADAQRYRQLVAKDEVSRQQYEAAATAAAAAQAQVAAQQAEVAAAQNAISTAQANIAVARGRDAVAAANVSGAATAPQQVAVTQAQAGGAAARVALQQAAVAQAELNLSYTVVRAPTNGLVGDKHLEIGQALGPGQQALVLVPLDQLSQDLWVTANFKETQLAQMRTGQPATAKVDAFDATLRAHVDSIGSATGAKYSLLPPENATGNYVKVVQRIPVKLVFEPGQDLGRLRPGMSVEVTVLEDQKR
ncbi:MAG: HlyD family secretion protein [Terriglobales bacterium]